MQTVLVNPGGTVKYVAVDGTIGAGGVTMTVPTGKIWKPIAFISDFTAGAGVGNRFLVLRVEHATYGVLFYSVMSAAVAATKICGYDIAFDGMMAANTTVRRNLGNTANTDVQVNATCPISMMMAGTIIRYMDTAAISAADAVSYKLVYIEYEA